MTRSGIHWDWDHDGFKAILEGKGTEGLVKAKADEICARANANNVRGGKGFGVKTEMSEYGRGRVVAVVHAEDYRAMIAESEDKALTKAIK